VLFNFSLDASLVRPQDVAAGLIWMTLVFDGLLGMGRTFHLENEDGALQGVLMSPAPKDAIFLGKALSNFTLLYVVALLVLGVFTSAWRSGRAPRLCYSLSVWALWASWPWARCSPLCRRVRAWASRCCPSWSSRSSCPW
jgi:hypothetical protein